MNATTAAQRAYDLMAEIPRDERGNPLTLEGAIRSIILKSPDLSPWRDRALDILYCGLGAAIDWIDGRLGDTTPNNYMNMPPQVGGQGIWSEDFGRDQTFAKMTRNGSPSLKKVLTKLKKELGLSDRERLKRTIETVEEIDDRCKTYGGFQQWYPISWYACRLCVPADAQQDFADGALETVQLILDNEVPPRTEKWICQQKNKRYAAQIKTVLEARAVAAKAPAVQRAMEGKP